MLIAEIHFTAREWLIPVLVLVSILALLSAWNYSRTPGSLFVRLGSWTLRALGLAILGLCLLEPTRSVSVLEEGANEFVWMIDNSQSMNIRNPGQSGSRGENLLALLGADQSPWQATMADQFKIRRYQFDNQLRMDPVGVDPDFSGNQTSLSGALKGIRDRFEGRPLAGVLLFTDGTASDWDGDLSALNGLPPVYPVLLGAGEGFKDIALSGLKVTQTEFEDAPVTIQADVQVLGLRGESVRTVLLDSDQNVVEEITRKIEDAQTRIPFRFQFKPRSHGVQFYHVKTMLESEWGSVTNPADSSESTLANNQRTAVVHRPSEEYRVLYVGGRPNWEYKFLNRALSDDDQVRLLGLLRIANKEPKFEFKGRAGESTNPLYRGFDKVDEVTERYDEAVTIRLNIRETDPDDLLRGGFPKDAEQLFQFHTVIIDDLEAAFFTRDQMNLVEKFVSERGGGFLMLGGQESFVEGGYDRTPIGGMLPVYLNRATELPPATEYRLELDREGWLETWTRVRNNEASEQERLENLPPFQVLNPVGGVKPGASVLMVVEDQEYKKHPALVTQRFGSGRTAAMLIGDFWRSRLKDETMKEDVDQLWRQLVRWLVTDVPRRVALELKPESGPAGEVLRLAVRVKDPLYRPADQARVTLEITPRDQGTEDEAVIRLQGEPSSKEAGLYEAYFMPQKGETFEIKAVATNEEGLKSGEMIEGWTHNGAAREFESLSPNLTMLESIVKKTGGEILQPEQLDTWASGLIGKPAPHMQIVRTPLWHSGWVLALALLCFVAEWGLRRSRGMP